eukprot:GHVT01040674.1.p1 GENE.GHVT01040674.1~~GHVT01040674.1.p1  ORF type:complete len:221 (+),score=21.44 GHVT01040674.1:641-1303(+)
MTMGKFPGLLRPALFRVRASVAGSPPHGCSKLAHATGPGLFGGAVRQSCGSPSDFSIFRACASRSSWLASRTCCRPFSSFISASGASGRSIIMKGADSASSSSPLTAFLRRLLLGSGTMCICISSPCVPLDYTASSAPPTESIFIAGKAISFLTQKIFENEVGPSFLMAVMFLAYLALMGHEGKIHQLVHKLKMTKGTNFHAVGHQRYAKFLPKNPLLKN